MKSSSEARRFLAGSFALSSNDRRLFIRKLFPYALSCVVCFCLVSASACAQNAPAQTPAPAAQGESQQNSAELTSRDEPTTFKVNVKLVVVRAVVRDPQGHAIGTLHKEDFQIFDKGKPQIISQFEVEQPGAITAKARQTSEENPTEAVTGEQPPGAGPLPVVPERFVAYVFDDVHLQFGDLAQVRQAAERHFATLRPTDRAAIFTTSGQGNLDFTDDRAKLHDALLRLQPRPISSGTGSSNDCPTMSFYEADQIQGKRDPFATSVAIQEATACLPKDPRTGQPIVNPATVVDSASMQVLEAGEHESRISLGILKAVVGNVSRMPGQRSVVLVSPGFIAPEMESEYNALIDHALRSQVVVNILDARGLYVGTAFGDISNPNTLPPSIAGPKALIETAAESAQADLLAVLADGTGGIFFHNNNDFDEGFRRVAQAPEYSYVLAFTPQDLKLDGSYHALKVTLKNRQKLTLQARRGYFAPKHLADPNEQAKQEIEDAMYSQEELHNLPVRLHTQFFKASEEDAKLVVLAHVDVQHLHFRKAEGRNNNVLTCVSAVFNRNGNFLQGTAKTVTMHWKDETLEHKLSSGITLKTSFDVKPGSYLVRLVVRDSEGQLMSAENGSVEIR
ncbi:MAG TPA: VWA domain-containing protein [Candidatus Eremiobacteraceae bacterium]|nr:VWA domain-containing protein [Candidatus Eremiobacteraceae bacterium]